MDGHLEAGSDCPNVSARLRTFLQPAVRERECSANREGSSNHKNSLFSAMTAIGIALLVGLAPISLSAQQSPAVSIGNTDLGGVVSGPNGPEAGVWVIAETSDLPTKMAKIVVTDDQGRYVMPDLPKANYDVWVRGYGLVDSPKVKAAPGAILNLTSVPAPNAAAAAQYYPPVYWFSMLNVPAKNEFPGTGPTGNGINAAI